MASVNHRTLVADADVAALLAAAGLRDPDALAASTGAALSTEALQYAGLMSTADLLVDLMLLDDEGTASLVVARKGTTVVTMHREPGGVEIGEEDRDVGSVVLAAAAIPAGDDTACRARVVVVPSTVVTALLCAAIDPDEPRVSDELDEVRDVFCRRELVMTLSIQRKAGAGALEVTQLLLVAPEAGPWVAIEMDQASGSALILLAGAATVLLELGELLS